MRALRLTGPPAKSRTTCRSALLTSLCRLGLGHDWCSPPPPGPCAARPSGERGPLARFANSMEATTLVRGASVLLRPVSTARRTTD